MTLSAPPAPARSLWEKALDLVFPPRCAGCRRPGAWICARCWPSVPWLGDATCSRCGRPTEGGVCATCPAKTARRGDWALPPIRAVARYEGAAREAVRELKYHQHHNIATLLGALMATRMDEERPILVPVPLHPARRRQRGYNQAELLAREVGKRLRSPVVAGRLRRVRPTADQVTLSAAERWHNVHGAFEWRGAPVDGLVVLVDDVCTTGSTLAACAYALRSAGMPRIRALVFARAVGYISENGPLAEGWSEPVLSGR